MFALSAKVSGKEVRKSAHYYSDIVRCPPPCLHECVDIKKTITATSGVRVEYHCYGTKALSTE